MGIGFGAAVVAAGTELSGVEPVPTPGDAPVSEGMKGLGGGADAAGEGAGVAAGAAFEGAAVEGAALDAGGVEIAGAVV